MNAQTRKEIYDLISGKVLGKIARYEPADDHKPFFTALFSEDMVLTASLVHSFYTMFGMSVYEQISVILAEHAGFEAERQYQLLGDIDLGTSNLIDNMWEHDKNNGSRDKLWEIEQIRNSIYPAREPETTHNDSTVDFFMRKPDGQEFYFDVKTVKPNKENFESFKRKILRWVGYRLSVDRDAQITTAIALPYNPHHPDDFFSGMAGVTSKSMDPNHDIYIQEGYWNLVGNSDSTYEQLLGIFVQVGNESRAQLRQLTTR